MNSSVRWIVAIAIVLFSWKGADLGLVWRRGAAVEKPSDVAAEWSEPLKPILPKMVVSDRLYMASFYDAMKFVILNDGERSAPIISDTDKFALLHASSLNLAIKRQNVGKYKGLGEAIDQVFLSALGAEQRPLDAAGREKLVEACAALAWAFSVGDDG